MRVRYWAAIAALVTVALAGCGAETPDYQSIWTTSSSTTTSAAPGDEKPVPIAAYLEQAGVTGTPVAPDKVTDLKVTMAQPPGWHPYENPRYAPGTRVIAKGDTYPMAMLMVFELTGDFDVAEAIEHGYVDAELSQNFTRLGASTENWKGFPSAMIEGSYDLNGRRMHSYNRIVIPTGKGGQRYLVQFTVTGYADKAAEEAPDIEAAIRGFDVTVPR